MARQPFDKQIVDAIIKLAATNRAVMRESISRVINLAQTPVAAGGNLPVQTGFL